MYKCFYCKQPLAREQAVVEHLLPRYHPDFNADKNIVLIHSTCNRRWKWWERLWFRISEKLDSFSKCYKESMGYTCRHRVYEDGTKECGQERNYWKGDDE